MPGWPGKECEFNFHVLIMTLKGISWGVAQPGLWVPTLWRADWKMARV